MNTEIFSTLGYVSVALGLSVPLLWVLHWLIKPRRWLCHLALIVGVAALVLARINSQTHVNRIQEDQSELIAAQKKAEEEERRRKEQERAEDVPDVHYMEDDRGDFMAVGAMDDSDRAYYTGSESDEASSQDDATPAWKREKKTRTQTTRDDSLEGAIGAVEATQGADTSGLGEAKTRPPIVMSKKDFEMAHRLDGVNLKVIRILVLLAVALLVFDYLNRFNSYRDAYLPLPLPSSWTSVFTSVPAIQERLPKPRRSVEKELSVMLKRGETFLYIGDSSGPDIAQRLRSKKKDILSVAPDGQELSADFIFDALWFGRCAFYVESHDVAEALLVDIVEFLNERKANRGKAAQTVHLVWNLSEPVPELLKQNILILGPPTGFSLFVCGTSN